MSIMSIRGASARPTGSSIIAGVWSDGMMGNLTFTPDIPGAVDLIVVLANSSNASPITEMTVIHAANRSRVLHGPPQSIRTNVLFTGVTAVAAIGFTQPITPTVTAGVYGQPSGPGLITVTDLAGAKEATANVPGVEWEAHGVQPASASAVVSALALVDQPHTWEIPEAGAPVVTTITW